MKKILLFDNYDSFTYNLLQYIEEIVGYEIVVKRNDEITIHEIEPFDIIILSPGPGLPKDAGILIDAIKTYSGKRPILGVCLGLQAIVETFGGTLKNLETVFHGLATEIEIIQQDSLFENLNSTLLVGRYHSWVANRNTLPNCFEIIAEDTASKEIMAIRHKKHFTKAVQFHPESILTPDGKQIIYNFLKEANAILS